MRGLHRQHLTQGLAAAAVALLHAARLAAQPQPGTIAAAPLPARAEALRFDAREKTVNVPSGQFEAHFTFAVTDVSPTNVTIGSLQTSCGCTAARLPTAPWILAPGQAARSAPP